jgi:hypothetical protein
MPKRSGQATFPEKLTYITTHLTDLFRDILSDFCLEVQRFLRISITGGLWLPFMRNLFKNFPDYINFPCSNATTLQGVLGLWKTVTEQESEFTRVFAQLRGEKRELVF